MKKFLVLSCFFLIWSTHSFTQQMTFVNKTVKIIQLKDSVLATKIDSFIVFERKCDYYNPELKIFIHFQQWTKGFYVSIGSDQELGAVEDDSLVFGGFFRLGHYVEVVANPDVKKNVVEIFFEKTEKELTVKRYDIIQAFDPEEVIPVEALEIDKFTIWRYWYRNGKFKLVGRYNFTCE